VDKSKQIPIDVYVEIAEFAKNYISHICEHFCDLVAAHIFGLAFDIALLRAFLVIDNPTQPGKEHPAPSYRMKLAYKRLVAAMDTNGKNNGTNGTKLHSAFIEMVSSVANKCDSFSDFSPNDELCYKAANFIFEGFKIRYRLAIP